MRDLPINFRGKLLLALVGSVGLLLGATLLVVRHETAREIKSVRERAAARTHVAFGELEGLRQADLARLALRFTASNRIPSALQAALEVDDPSILRGAAAYELALAEIPRALVSIADLEGRPVVTLIEGDTRPEALALDPVSIERLFKQAALQFDYQLVAGQLFTVHRSPLDLFGVPLGVLTLGLPVDDELAAHLGRVVDAEVCFAVGQRCLAATPAARGFALERLLSQIEHHGQEAGAWLDGQRWALVADRLGARGEEGEEDAGAVWRVIAVPLEGALGPFDRIRQSALWSGLAALLLALVLGSLLARGLSRPLSTLVAATEQIAQGNLTHRVEVRSRDEIGALATAFNEMTAGLRMKEQYRGVLDKVVSPEIASELLRGEISLGGETRRVSVLFADLRGFTPLVEGMAPQEVVALLNEYLERGSEAVEAEGGVVDKYVGDEIMAIFGAPVSHADDALRAVRAGIRIREALTELNRKRVERGQPSLAVGIGINTGEAVAGNTGSSTRLNYTVLGESVNVASRLCTLAQPGQILISEATFGAVEPRIAAEPLGARSVKGLSRPLSIYAVRGLRPTEGAPSGPGMKPLLGSLALILTVLCSTLLAWAVPAASAPVFHFIPSGRINLDAYLPQEDAPWIIEETRPFVAGRLSLFLDLFLGDRLYGMAELHTHRGEPPADRPLEGGVRQAFVRLAPIAGRPHFVQVGSFASPFGGYALRHDTPADPFIRPPLLYDYRTVVSSRDLPAANNGFLDWKHEPAVRRPRGAPIIWGVPYPAGAMLFGALGPVDYRLAALNSSLASEPSEWRPRFDQRRAPGYVAHLGYVPVPALRLGGSYHRGPFLQEDVDEDRLPAGRGVTDFLQEAWGFHAAFARGRFEGNAELVLDRWEVPNVVRDPRDRGYYIEGKLKLKPGLYAAGRFSAIDFNRIDRLPPPSAPEGAIVQRERWDHPVRRWQTAVGYRLTRSSEIRAEYLHNVHRGSFDPRDNLFSVQWWREF